MNGALGMAGIALGLAASILGGITLVLGVVQHRSRLVRSGTIYVWLVLAGAVLSVGAMERALITRDFSLTFVADNGSAATPALYNVASLWSALEGSILLWTIILALYLVATFLWFRRRLQDPLVSWALVVLFTISAFFFLLLAGPANPFGRVSGTIPTSGPGPNPLLQNHPLMVIHPPMLYLGYVGFSVPFAFAIAGLVTGRVGEGWLLDTRRWTLFAWGFLSIGIVLGAWWSYEVLGWGGVWGWDPVENASLLPWLTATAFIHSVLVQERRGMLRVWNLSLLCATFCLTILGTFLTRSGVIESVHAFSDGPARRVPAGLLRPRRRDLGRPDRVAGRSPPLARFDRLAALPRRRVPRQQPRLLAVRLRRAARHRLPADRRGAAGPPPVGGPPVLRPDDDPARPRPPDADGHRPRAPVAQGVGRAPAPAAVLAGLPRRGLHRRAGAARGGRHHAAAGLRAGWLRRGFSRFASWCWPLAGRAGGAWWAGPTAA